MANDFCSKQLSCYGQLEVIIMIMMIMMFTMIMIMTIISNRENHVAPCDAITVAKQPVPLVHYGLITMC